MKTITYFTNNHGSFQQLNIFEIDNIGNDFDLNV